MDEVQGHGEKAPLEGKLVPIMREGVEVIKMVFFKKLKEGLQRHYPDRDVAFRAMLAGAVINELFGTPNPDAAFVAFEQQHRGCIDQALKSIAAEFAELRIPLTDALRVQFLCDSLAGHDDPATLLRARELDILIPERDVPLPKHFLELVRRLGKAFNILVREAAVH